MPDVFGLTKHTILVTASTWRHGSSRAGQLLLDLCFGLVDLIIDTVFLAISKFPGFVEL